MFSNKYVICDKIYDVIVALVDRKRNERYRTLVHYTAVRFHFLLTFQYFPMQRMLPYVILSRSSYLLHSFDDRLSRSDDVERFLDR